MTSRSLSAGLSELESLIKSNPENVLWSGPSDRNTFQELINIPLRLPAGGRYQFTAKGSTLVVASIGDREISSFGFAAEVAGRVTTELTEEGARISNFGSSRFDT